MTENPAYQGLMFRLLLGARLWVPVPPHPEMIGDHPLDARRGFSWCVFSDHEGDFTAVFTIEEIAKQMLEKVAGPTPMIAEVEARVLFGMFKDRPVKVRVIASKETRLVKDPEADYSTVGSRLARNSSGDRTGISLLL